MGAPNKHDLIPAEAALKMLAWSLDKASGEGANRRVVLDQFRWGGGEGLAGLAVCAGGQGWL